MRPPPGARAVVVGAGAFGAWTAHYLQLEGMRVTLIDMYGVAHSRSSSGDESRILRCGYGRDAVYSDMARRSLEAWKSLDAHAGRVDLPIWHPCGVLWLAAGGDAYTAATKATLEAGRHAVEALDGQALRARMPLIATGDIEMALFEPDAGVLSARRAIQRLARVLHTRGVIVERAQAQVTRPPFRSLVATEGRTFEADVFVFACGAWLPKVFPELLGACIHPTRQEVIYFGTPAGDDRFTAARLPAWVDFPSGIYGVPDIEGRGVKVGVDTHGPPIDPDTADRTADPETVEIARRWLGRRLPALTDAPVVETRVCQYENTSNGDFLIDRHPAYDNVWIVGGGSGHGFKHGPAIGEYVAGMVFAKREAEPRFLLDRKGTERNRAVY
jgi:sarcosine oxidase